MRIGTVDLDKLRGVAEKFVGLSKELTGVLIDNDRLQRAGSAQQEKATEMLKALSDEARAEAQEQKARAIHRTVPGSAGTGVVAEGKGKLEQAAANLVGDSDLERQGRADEERGAAGRRATGSRVSARSHEGKAKAAEAAEQAEDAANS
jgi:uncharacterized protein YjbJ (UPF0337 family)